MKKLVIGILVVAFILMIFAGCKTETLEEPEETTTEAEVEDTTTYPELKIEITSDGNRIYENMTNYVFIPDDDVIGEWTVVDFVYNIDDFDPNIKEPTVDNWQSIKLFDDGTAILQLKNMSFLVEKWTKEYIFMSIIDMIQGYTLKQINGINYLFVEWKAGKYILNGIDPVEYYVFKKISSKPTLDIYQYQDIRSKDIHVADLTNFGKNIRTLSFNDKTKFPPKDKLPSNKEYQPEYILEAGKNPGFGVRALHEQGITGKGVNVAIIDSGIADLNHPEFKDKISEYTYLGDYAVSYHGPLVLSLLAGENVGTAPGVSVYYYATEKYIDSKGDAEAYAIVLDIIVEENKTLPENEKIRIVSISACPTSSDPRWINTEKYIESYKRATEAGILVLDCSPENGIIGSCEYDYENPEDITKCKFVDLSGGYPFNINDTVKILAPAVYRTTAEVYTQGDFMYNYHGLGGWSSAVPYAAGVLAMGWQVNPALTADEIVQILIDTAYVDKEGYKYINPPAFIEYIQTLNN
ncbi:MAG: S8 family serine peptidase [Oscillospiraceae bacterium]|nr:S8 family serine peptidase [Oscillospiraceae bacterium]